MYTAEQLEFCETLGRTAENRICPVQIQQVNNRTSTIYRENVYTLIFTCVPKYKAV